MLRVFDHEMEVYTMEEYKARSLQSGTLTLMPT